MNEYICVGRKEIIQLFQEAGMLGMHLSVEDGWRIILRWRSRYAGMPELFQHLPNGKPIIYRAHFLVWVKAGRRKLPKGPVCPQ